MYTPVRTHTVIISKILPMIENNGLKHLIIPDLLNAIEKDYTTRNGFFNLIKTLTKGVYKKVRRDRKGRLISVKKWSSKNPLSKTVLMKPNQF